LYRELAIFTRQVAFQKSIWKDGDLWTSVVAAAAMFFWMRSDVSVMNALRDHFSDALTFSSIILGFALTTLVFYLPLVSEWRKTPAVQRAAERIIDWHVWTVLWVFLQIVLTVLVALTDGRVHPGIGARPFAYAAVVFTSIYASLQLVNHSLTIWWVFKKRQLLGDPPASDQRKSADGAGEGVNKATN
jgi:hypothetical protein